NLPTENLVGLKVADVLAPIYEGQIRPRLERAFNGERQEYELQIPAAARDGEKRHYAVSYEPQTTPGGNVVVVVIMDITESRRAEARLRMQAAALEAAANGIVLTDRQGVILWANPALLKLLGYSLEELVGAKPSLFKSGRHDDAFYREMWTTVLRGEVWRGEIVNRRKDGSLYTEEMTITPVRDEQGEIGHFIAIKQDITARKQAEAALAQRKEHLRLFIQHSPAALAMFDRDMRYLAVSRRWLTDYGIAEESVIGRSHYEIFREIPERWKEIHRRCLGGAVERSEEDSFVRADGRTEWLRWEVRPWHTLQGGIGGILIFSEDITERKAAELALREATARLQLAVQASNIGLWDWDLRDNTVFYSREYKRQLGYEDPEFSNRLDEWQKRVHPDDLETVLREENKYLAEGRGFLEAEFRMRHKDGTYRWLYSRAELLRGAEGKPQRLLGCHIDITRRKQFEQELHRREEHFRMLIENGSDIITIINGKAEFKFQSPSIKRLLGYEPAELIGRNAFEFIHADDAAKVTAAIEQALTHPRTATQPVEFRFRHQNGSWRVLQSIGTCIPDEAPDGFIVANSRDVTEQRQMEEQFRQSQKMEAVGLLAGGVAHDFNNMLLVMQGHAGLLAMGENLTPEQLESTQEINKAAERAANLTRQLLLFSRRQALQLRDLDLNETVTNMTKMLRRIVGEDIAIQCRYSPQPLLLHADAGMMDQILLNLSVNARDAMPKGGSLVIETAVANFTETADATVPHARPGSFACLTLSDTGSGIAPEVLPRIFEPFFTTKGVGKGTGLGLATVFGIVQQHQGWITVESKPDEGTKFRIYLPRLTAPSQADASPASIASLRGGSETILLVEDDLALRRVVRNILVRLGYRVLEATTGLEALELWTEHQSSVALLFTDLVMPDGMSGAELAQVLLKHNPQLEVIYTSGYSPDIAGKDVNLREGVNFVAKPFEAQKLAQIVRARLDRSREPV
ncbi:MAG: PAS domain S-box protein, partial [Verrucomicrobia bacterium]